jgi:hypothetical protein
MVRAFAPTAGDLQLEPHHRWAHLDGLRCTHTRDTVSLAAGESPQTNRPGTPRAKQTSCFGFDCQVAGDREKRGRYQRILGKALDGQRNVNLVPQGKVGGTGDAQGAETHRDRGLWAKTEKDVRTRAAFGAKAGASTSLVVAARMGVR